MPFFEVHNSVHNDCKAMGLISSQNLKTPKLLLAEEYEECSVLPAANKKAIVLLRLAVMGLGLFGVIFHEKISFFTRNF
jgi:hypothetical protein